MKKYVIIVLVLIGALQLYNSNLIEFEESGHGLEEVVPINNSIYVIDNKDINDFHATMYPNDRFVMFQYTLIEEVDSIEFYIGDELVYTALIIEEDNGEFFILISEDNQISIHHRSITIIDEFNFNSVTSSVSKSLDVVFPTDKEYHFESFGIVNPTINIAFNERINLYSYSRGYDTQESDDSSVHFYEVFDASVSVVFIKK